MKQKNKNHKLGFTLLELLVVVLIIGILAAIALPQYRRSVEKSKATQALVILDSLRQSFNAYYLANGKYPTKFGDVDVSLSNMTGHVEQVNVGQGAKDTISDNNWSLQIQGDTTYYLIMMTRISGKYKGGGFIVSFFGTRLPAGTIECQERLTGGKFIISKSGIYCEEVMNATLLYKDSIAGNYSL